MQAFFTQVAFKQTSAGEVLTNAGAAKTKHPRDGREVFAHALLRDEPEASPEGDRRALLADWLVAPENPWFAKNLANRLWAHFLGRGLVEPVDDFRLANPPSNPELLDALADYLVEHHFDPHALIRLIAASETYQRSTEPNASNQDDEWNFSRFLLKRLDAEVLLDAVSQATGVDEKFSGVPAGSRAIQLWDSNVPHYFLTLFGRPIRATACQCERVVEPTVSQVLHVLNSPEIQDKLSHDGGRVARWAASDLTDEALVDEIYHTFFGRPPTDQERDIAAEYLASGVPRRQALEDLAWSMLNSLEFLFNH